MGVHSVSEELGEVALPHHGDDQEHESNTGDQQDRLDHLHVGGALHAADEDVGHHHQADDHDDDGLGSLGVQVQQDGDEGAGTGHLSDQVEQRGEQGREGCGHAHRALLQAEGEHVRHGELTGVTQWLGDQQQGDEPRNEESDGVQEAVVARERNRADDAQEGRRREVVAGDRQAILGTGEGSTTRVEVGRGLLWLGGSLRHDVHRHHDEGDEHADVQDRVCLLRRSKNEIHSETFPFLIRGVSGARCR